LNSGELYGLYGTLKIKEAEEGREEGKESKSKFWK